MILQGNALHIPLADESVDMCVTSTPYYGLRDYGTAKWEGGDLNCDHKGKPMATHAGFNERYFCKPSVIDKQGEVLEFYKDICGKCGAKRVDNQLGLEKSPDEYVANLVAVFREVWRVLKPQGTLWLNLGDSYAGSGRGINENGKQGTNKGTLFNPGNSGNIPNGLKPKDLIGIPWMVAFALRSDGWYLRQDIIWAKLNPMPESIKDRCTKSHEYIFLLAKSKKYYFDHAAMLEPANYDGRKDTMMNGSNKYKNGYVPNQSPQTVAARGHERWPKRLYPAGNNQTLHDYKHSGYWKENGSPLFQLKNGIPARNRRDVWFVPTEPYNGAHFAVFPTALIEPCILAGCPEGGIVLDPFFGSGTTGLVAVKNNRHFIGIDLNMQYCRLAQKRFSLIQPVLPNGERED